MMPSKVIHLIVKESSNIGKHTLCSSLGGFHNKWCIQGCIGVVDLGWFWKQSLYLNRKELQLKKRIEKCHGFNWFGAISNFEISLTPLAFLKSSFGTNFTLYASYIQCFSNIKALLISIGYHFSISIHVSSCGWCLCGAE
jgi:hypothetical protein